MEKIHGTKGAGGSTKKKKTYSRYQNYILCNDISNEFEKYHCLTTFFAVLLLASEKNHQCEPQSSAKQTVSVGRELAV